MEEKQDLNVIKNETLAEISEDELPNVISAQYSQLIETDKQVQIAMAKCEESRKKAEKQVASKGIGKNDAINSTQDAVRSIADAQESLASAQKMLFENQQKLADGMRFLLMLGTSSIAMNRAVIEQLQKKLSQASKEELSELARNELMGIIKMLKEQESSFSKQDKLAKQISETKNTVLFHEKVLEDIQIIDKKQNAKDLEHDKLLLENERHDSRQDEEIEIQKLKDNTHDKLLKRVHLLAWSGVGLGFAALIIAVISLIL